LDWIEEKVWTRNRWRSVSGHNTTHNATVGDHCIYLQAEVTPITERNIDLYVLYKWLCAQRERERESQTTLSLSQTVIHFATLFGHELDGRIDQQRHHIDIVIKCYSTFVSLKLVTIEGSKRLQFHAVHKRKRSIRSENG